MNVSMVAKRATQCTTFNRLTRQQTYTNPHKAPTDCRIPRRVGKAVQDSFSHIGRPLAEPRLPHRPRRQSDLCSSVWEGMLWVRFMRYFVLSGVLIPFLHTSASQASDLVETAGNADPVEDRHADLFSSD